MLVSDRSDISPEKLAQLQSEIIEVIKRYLDVDDAHVHIKLEQRARENYLVADIPLARDKSYGMLPILDAPPENEAGQVPPEPEPEEPEPEAKAEKPAQATTPRKPRATSSSGKSGTRKKQAAADTEAESDPSAS